MTLNPYLFFDGDCKQAFAFYEQAIDAKIEAMMSWGEGPAAGDMPAEAQDRIMHASLLLGEERIMASDETPAENYQPITGIRVVINANNAADAERYFANLAQGGKVDMPMEETFWAERFGMLTDQFGVPWMVNCDKPQE